VPLNQSAGPRVLSKVFLVISMNASLFVDEVAGHTPA